MVEVVRFGRRVAPQAEGKDQNLGRERREPSAGVGDGSRRSAKPALRTELHTLCVIRYEQEFRNPGKKSGAFLLSRHVMYEDRKSTRLNSSHGYISYAVF